MPILKISPIYLRSLFLSFKILSILTNLDTFINLYSFGTLAILANLLYDYVLFPNI
jgi:hypothetical protein